MKTQLSSTDKPLFKAALGVMITMWGLFMMLFIGACLPWIGGPLGGLVCWIGLEFFVFHHHQGQTPSSVSLVSPSKKRFWWFF